MAVMDEAAVAIELPQAEGWSAAEVLNWGFEQFGRRIAIASAFGVEGMVLIDLASRLRRNFRVFTLDTGFFFPETYALIGEAERRYGITVERCHPAGPDRGPGPDCEGRVGFKVQSGQDQSSGGLGVGQGLGVCPRQARSLQSASRPELPEHRLHALHTGGRAG